MFSFFLQPLAVAAEPTVVVESEGPAVTPDITKVDSIEDGFGYFRILWEKTVEWFRSEQENLLELAIGIAVTIIVAFLVRWLFRALLPKLIAFFRKKGIVPAILFMLTYRLGESQLVKLASPFLLDGKAEGGLALSTAEVGFAYGTVGVIALLLGGILGGMVISRHGLKRWFWPMALAVSLPNLVYLYMAYAQPDSIFIINSCVAIEQFGYGFGFTAYTMYLMLFAEGEYKTSHYAISTGFMALGMMLPGMVSGWIQEMVGYQNFFVWVMVCCIPAFFVLPFLKIPETGKTEK